MALCPATTQLISQGYILLVTYFVVSLIYFFEGLVGALEVTAP